VSIRQLAGSPFISISQKAYLESGAFKLWSLSVFNLSVGPPRRRLRRLDILGPTGPSPLSIGWSKVEAWCSDIVEFESIESELILESEFVVEIEFTTEFVFEDILLSVSMILFTVCVCVLFTIVVGGDKLGLFESREISFSESGSPPVLEPESPRFLNSTPRCLVYHRFSSSFDSSRRCGCSFCKTNNIGSY
jgi:hypothetical protein